MPTVVPSQIVQFIDTAFPNIKATTEAIKLEPSVCGALSALLRLIEELPNTLLPTDPEKYARFIRSQESIRVGIRRAEDLPLYQAPLLHPDRGGQPSQVLIIRDALADCPDEVPPHHSKELRFISDPDFRKTLLIDLEACRSALRHGEWKAATVLAGSLAEAMLLWSIQERPNEVKSACDRALAARKLQRKPPADPLDWVLHHLVEVAEEMNLIEPDTAKQTRLAKDFRNLIHPGRSIRMQQFCDRGTALGANAAVELISRDLQASFPVSV